MKNDISEKKKDVDEEMTIDDEDTFKKIEFEDEDKKTIIKNVRKLKKILEEDDGHYIISCLETIPCSNFNPQHVDHLVKLLRYEYSHGIVNLLLASLINPPFYILEIHKFLKENKVKTFLDEINIKYGNRITSLYKCHIGELDWQYIKSSPIIRDDAIALTSKITLANGDVLTFTAPLRSLPTISYHFLKHINRTIDFMKERALSEIEVDGLERVGKELEKIIDRLKEYEESTDKKADDSGEQK